MSNTQNNTSQSGGSYIGGGWRAHGVLIILMLVYISDYADRYVVSSMLNFIKEDWNITDAQAGSLMSVVLLFITIFTLPVSILIDRWSRRKVVSLMIMLWSLATLACAFTRNFTQLIVARAFIGIGEAGYAPGGMAMLAAAYSEDKRAKVMGIWNAAIPLGVGLGLFAGGEIAVRWGWQHAFGLVALPGMILAVIAWFLPDYKTVRVEDSAAGFSDWKGFTTKAVGVIRIPSLILTYLGFAMNVSITTALMHWLATYFERSGLAEPGKGGTYTIPIFALVLVGAPLGGFLSDAWHKRRPEGRLIFPALTSIMATATLFIAFLFVGQKVQIPILVLYGIFATCFVAPAASVTQDVVHPGLRAFSYAMCVLVQHLFGDIWSPTLVGVMSDNMGLEKAMLFVPVYGLAAAAFFYAASRFYNRDLERVEKVELEPE